jgi:23S rRNA (adenine2503-C2)-methyltransferase
MAARDPSEVAPEGPLPDLRDLTREAMRAFVQELGEPAYRGDQIFRAIWRQGARSFDDMTTLPKALRERLATSARISTPEIAQVDTSTDGTQKVLLRLEDGRKIETVLIPDGDRLTLCISSQVGCALACRFCATGTMGLTRHMRPGEIVCQILAAQELLLGEEQGRKADPHQRPVTNIVMMGMGEPLHNYDGTLAALQILTDETAFDYAPARITVSTVGLVPQMLALGEALPVRLAVSLHAGDPETRRDLMPIDRKYPMEEVLEACRQFPLKTKERITFEYTLLRGVNDRPVDAENLARALEGLRCKVNLLAFNEHEGAPFERPEDDSVLAFSERLRSLGVDAFVRTTRGRDIAAACGQLAVGPRKRKDRDTAAAPPV